MRCAELYHFISPLCMYYVHISYNYEIALRNTAYVLKFVIQLFNSIWKFSLVAYLHIWHYMVLFFWGCCVCGSAGKYRLCRGAGKWQRKCGNHVGFFFIYFEWKGVTVNGLFMTELLYAIVTFYRQVSRYEFQVPIYY